MTNHGHGLSSSLTMGIKGEGQEIMGQSAQPKQLSASQIVEVVVRRSHTIIDTRPWEKFRYGHLPDSLFVPLDLNFTSIMSLYVELHEPTCLVLDPNHLQPATSCLIQMGFNRVDSWISLEQIEENFNAGGPIARVEPIRMQELANRLGHQEILALDVRTEAELIETGRIEGSLNITHTQLLQRRRELPINKNIHVYCRTSNRSRLAYALLERLGYSATLVEGGIVEWQALRYPLVSAGRL